MSPFLHPAPGNRHSKKDLECSSAKCHKHYLYVEHELWEKESGRRKLRSTRGRIVKGVGCGEGDDHLTVNSAGRDGGM